MDEDVAVSLGEQIRAKDVYIGKNVFFALCSSECQVKRAVFYLTIRLNRSRGKGGGTRGV